jgi:Na+-transporting methylmalonyl-CoA/oxaloacetate decarboxylase gamma subunit
MQVLAFSGLQIAVVGIAAVFLVLVFLAALVKGQSKVVQTLEKRRAGDDERRIRAAVIAAVQAYIEEVAES